MERKEALVLDVVCFSCRGCGSTTQFTTGSALVLDLLSRDMAKMNPGKWCICEALPSCLLQVFNFSQPEPLI